MRRRHRGVDIDVTPSGGWFVAHVLVTTSSPHYYQIVKADTLPGIRSAINDILDANDNKGV